MITPDAQVSCVLALSGAAPQQGGREVEVTFIGDLTDTEHQVSGKVYVLDEDTLVIDQFSYDGNGFGVYINVATKGRNKKTWAKNRIDVPYPSGTEVHKSIKIICIVAVHVHVCCPKASYKD